MKDFSCFYIIAPSLGVPVLERDPRDLSLCARLRVYIVSKFAASLYDMHSWRSEVSCFFLEMDPVHFVEVFQ